MSDSQGAPPASGIPLTKRASSFALVGAWLLFFAPQIFSTAVPYYRDHLVTNVPLRQYTRDRLLSGELPQWYPFESLGVPVIGQIALGTFHPFTFLLLPFSAPVAEKWALLLTYLFGLIGAYRLARGLGASRFAALVGGISFAFGGYALGVSSIITYAISQSTLPWVAWAALRVTQKQRLKDAALLGALWSLLFLAGDAIGFFLAGAFGLLALLHAPSRRGATLFVLGGLVASLLVGIELLPATRVAQFAIRNVGQMSPTLGLTWALHPLRTFELFIPGFVPDDVRYRVVGELFSGGTSLFATTLFAGGLVLVLASAGLADRRRVVWGFVALGAVALLFAWGDRAGVLPVLRRAVPLFARFRYPERYLAFFWVSLSVLCALGVDRALAAPKRFALRLLGVAVIPAVLCALAGSAGLAQIAWRSVGRTLADERLAETVNAAWTSGLGWTAGLLLVAGVLFLVAGRQKRVLPLLAVLVFAELWHGNGAHLPLVDRAFFEQPNAFTEAVTSTRQESAPLGRVMQETPPFFDSTVSGPGRERWVAGMMHLLKTDVSGMFGVTGLNSNLGATQLRHAMLLGSRDELALQWAPVLHTCFHVARTGRQPGPNERMLAANAALDLVMLQAPCLPRAFFAGTVAASSLEQAAERLSNLPRDGSVVVWEGGPELPAARGEIRWKRFAPERLELEVEASAPAALVLSEDLMPGWSATVDGSSVEIHPTLLTLRGVEVPEGKHEVAFTYRTPRLALGFASTLAGVLLALALAFSNRARRRS